MRPEHPIAEDIAALRELWQEAFRDTDAFLDSFFATAFSPKRCLRIMQEGRAVSAAYWLDVELQSGKGAYIYAVATAKDHRGQGFAHRIMAGIHADLQEKGYVAAILVPGEPGLENFYGTIGYRFFGGVRSFSAISKSPGAALRSIRGAEYAALRKTYLPAGAVVQEGENMDFLESYAQLYAGDGFILAAYREEDTLSGLELLGDAAKAPHILQALGAEQGSFRTPGQQPFAMWLPFTGCEEPTYFGLAFD